MTTYPSAQGPFPTVVRSENLGVGGGVPVLGTPPPLPWDLLCLRREILFSSSNNNHSLLPKAPCLDLAFDLQQPPPGLTRDQKYPWLGCQAAAEQARGGQAGPGVPAVPERTRVVGAGLST